MRQGIILAVLALFLASWALTGCADQKVRNEQYSNYLEANKELAALKAAHQKPVVDLKYTDSGGKDVNLTVYLPEQNVQVQQIKDDEYIQLYGAMINAGGNILTQGINVIGNGYFSYKKDQAMWEALGDSLGGGVQVDSGGGPVTLSNVGNVFKQQGNTGSYFGFAGLDYANADHESSNTPGSSGGTQSNETKTEETSITTSGSHNQQ